MTNKRALIFVGLFAFVLATSPIFFDIYRTAVFNTVPHDDYATHLMAMIGQGGRLPGAPYYYRPLSVAVAIPFYYILPIYKFTNLPAVEPAYLRATEALAFISYLSLVLTALVIYVISRKQYFANKSSALIVGLFTFFLSGFISTVGIDPFAIFVISLLVLVLGNPLLFAPLILVSMGINEKIPILLSTILAFRFIFALLKRRPFKLYIQLIASCLAVAGYFAARILIKVPGIEVNSYLTSSLANWQSTLMDTFSLKGLFLNVLPIFLMSIIILFAIKSHHQDHFQVSDVSALFILVILAFTANLEYTVGRIVMYSYPLYLPVVACYIDDVLKQDNALPNTKIE